MNRSRSCAHGCRGPITCQRWLKHERTWRSSSGSSRPGATAPSVSGCETTAEFVGSSGLHPRPAESSRREIGYWVRTSHAGRGFATEAVLAIARTGFAALGLTAIEIRASERNVASQRVAERAGFRREGLLDDGRLDPDGHPSRTVVYLPQPDDLETG